MYINFSSILFYNSLHSSGYVFFHQWVFISVSHCGYGGNVLLQYVITANKAHNTENMATIAFNIHNKIELMALGHKTIFVFAFVSSYSYKLQL